MRKSRCTDSQIMAVLKQAEAGVKVPDLCREHGISSATFYKWRSRFGGMDTSMIFRGDYLRTRLRNQVIIHSGYSLLSCGFYALATRPKVQQELTEMGKT